MPVHSSTLKVSRDIRTLRELTLEKLRDAIVSSYFKPGDRLVERTLCDQLGVSRTVVREVLRHLETEGLVDSLPNQGPIVARLDPGKVAEIYELRALLEGDAARACATLCDAKTITALRRIHARIQDGFAANDFRQVLLQTQNFYESMFAAGKKRVAWEVVQGLHLRINQLRALTIASPGRASRAKAEMESLIEALAAHDGKAAHAAAVAHVQRTAEIALKSLEGKVDGAPLQALVSR